MHGAAATCKSVTENGNLEGNYDSLRGSSRTLREKAVVDVKTSVKVNWDNKE